MTPAKPLLVSDLPGHHDAGGRGSSRSAKPGHVAGRRGEQPGCLGEPQPEHPAPARLGKGRYRATRQALGWHQEGTQSFPRPPQRPQPRNGWYFLAKRAAAGHAAEARGFASAGLTDPLPGETSLRGWLLTAGAGSAQGLRCRCLFGTGELPPQSAGSASRVLAIKQNYCQQL